MLFSTDMECAEYTFEYMCKVVDSLFRAEKAHQVTPSKFWRRIISDVTMQQLFTKCLIFKYISFTCGLGDKPLVDSIFTIKSVTTAALTAPSALNTNLKNQVTITRHGSLVLELSPLKYYKSQNNRKRNEEKSFGKISTTDNPSVHCSKPKWKYNDGIIEKNTTFLETGLSDEDRRKITKLRELMYTIAFVSNCSDLRKWNFNQLRDVFLLWNKVRNWKHAASPFETKVMKRFSRPSNSFDAIEEWGHTLSEILDLQTEEAEWSNTLSLQDNRVGDSIKYWVLRSEIEKSSSSVIHVILSIISLLKKFQVQSSHNNITLKILLHLFYETVILAPYVPFHILQLAYESIQILYLLPLSISTVVKEVLNLIQSEMKSPGCFRRTIFFQEQDTHAVIQNLNVEFLSVHVFVDKKDQTNHTLNSALETLSRKSEHSAGIMTKDQERLLVEQIYHSVFGPDCCELPTLRKTLKTCHTSQLTLTCLEALDIMQQAASMESPVTAQDFVRKQLEVLSYRLTDELAENSSSLENLTETESKSSIFGDSVSISFSAPNLVNAPPRNQSHLNRAATSNSVSLHSETSLTTAMEERCVVKEMDYSRMQLQRFECGEIFDVIFDLVRKTAKDFVQKKRRTSSNLSSQEANREKQNPVLRSSTNIKNSRLLEDNSQDKISNKHDDGFLNIPNKIRSPKKITEAEDNRSTSSDHYCIKINQKHLIRSEQEIKKVDGLISMTLAEYDAIEVTEPLNNATNGLKTFGDEVQVCLEDDKGTRNRIDSEIKTSKAGDNLARLSPDVDSHSEDSLEKTSLADVKFSRKKAVRRNRSSLSQSPTQLVQRKVLKLAFIGNDNTVGDLARAYYQLRKEQTARTLLHHIDLHLYYIPIGKNAFDDEIKTRQDGVVRFDLEIAKMLGAVDSWYQLAVTHSCNNLLRVRPSINTSDFSRRTDSFQHKTYTEKIQSGNNKESTPENILANAIAGYLRFATKACHIPIFKATMRTSTDDIITEVFCCRAEIGYEAYKQAIIAGRFGKLVDLSNDSGPPQAYSIISYTKYGINGTFVSSHKLEEVNYFRVKIVPLSLSNSDSKEQDRFSHTDDLEISVMDEDKRAKMLKKEPQMNLGLDYTEKHGDKFSASDFNMEVVRPVQGTFTVSLDHTLIYTNIKRLEVSPCLAPEYERQKPNKRTNILSFYNFLSLPLKIF